MTIVWTMFCVILEVVAFLFSGDSTSQQRGLGSDHTFDNMALIGAVWFGGSISWAGIDAIYAGVTSLNQNEK